MSTIESQAATLFSLEKRGSVAPAVPRRNSSCRAWPIFLSTNEGGAMISLTVQAVDEAATLLSDFETKARAVAASIQPASGTELWLTGIQGKP